MSALLLLLLRWLLMQVGLLLCWFLMWFLLLHLLIYVFLLDIRVDNGTSAGRRLGGALSKKIYQIFTEKDPEKVVH